MGDKAFNAGQSPADAVDQSDLSMFYFVREVEPGRVLEMGRRFNSNAAWAGVMALIGLAFGVVMTINVNPNTRTWGYVVTGVMAVLVLACVYRFSRGTLYRIDRSREVIELERAAGRVSETIPFAEVEGVQLVLTSGSPGRRTAASRWTLLTFKHKEERLPILRSFVSHRGSDAPDDHETVQALAPLARVVADWIGTDLLPIEEGLA